MNASVTKTVKSGVSRSFSLVFVSADLPGHMRTALRARNLTVVPLPAFDRLPAPVAKHADMLLFPYQGGLLLHEGYYRANKRLFDGVKVTTTDEPIGCDYPQDVLLNALQTAVGTFCRAASTSVRIKDAAAKIINVAQGYTRCAACAVDDHSLITADPSIATAARDNGLDVLEVCSGEILLPGYSYGFLGGCSARLGDELFFTGDITAHPDYGSIEAFACAHGAQPVALSTDPLTDYGGFVMV